MAARTGLDARLMRTWQRAHPQIRCERRHRQIALIVEALEVRLVLAGTSPSNPVPIGPGPDGTANPRSAGAAYQEVVAVQTLTLQSLGDCYRGVQAAGAQFASRVFVAIDQLNAELRESRHNADAIAAAIGRDHDLLDRGGADVAHEEQGLDVARGLADQQANTDEIDIVNGLYTKLADLVQQNQSTDTAISGSGRRSEKALVRELEKLGDHLTFTIPVRTLVRS
jgi:hypothetical protein